MLSKQRFAFALGLTLVASLVFGPALLMAQDSVLLGNAVVVGDPNTPCAQQAQQFIQSGDLSQAGQNLQFSDPFFNTPMTAQQAQGSLGNIFRQGTFDQPQINAMTFIASDTVVAAELTFTGMATADFLSNAQTQFTQTGVTTQQDQNAQQGQTNNQQNAQGQTNNQQGQSNQQSQSGQQNAQAQPTNQPGQSDQQGQTNQGQQNTQGNQAQAGQGQIGAQTGQQQGGLFALPVSAFFHCDDNGQIDRVNLYYDRETFMTQLGFGNMTALGQSMQGMQGQMQNNQQGQMNNQQGQTNNQQGQQGAQGQTSSAGTCTVVAQAGDINLRQGPGIDTDQMGMLASGQTAQIVGQFSASDGVIWWQTSDGFWISSDVATVQEGDCMGVPTVQGQ